MAKWLLAAAIGAASILISAAASADVKRAACPFFPHVPWWADTTHASVSRYVEENLGGHWSAYIARWQKELARLKGIRSRGNVAVIDAAGVRLEGPKLTHYIEQVEQRIAVMACLSGAGLVTVETASGDVSQSVLSGEPAMFDLVSRDGLLFELGIRCRNGNAYVSLTNHGLPWDQALVVAVIDPLTLAPSATRRFLLDAGQRVSYRVLAKDVVHLRVTANRARGPVLHEAELRCPAP